MLLSFERQLPIVVASQDAATRLPMFDADALDRDVQGIAHVVCLTPAMTYSLSNAIGKPRSTFNGPMMTNPVHIRSVGYL